VRALFSPSVSRSDEERIATSSTSHSASLSCRRSRRSSPRRPGRRMECAVPAVGRARRWPAARAFRLARRCRHAGGARSGPQARERTGASDGR
jgi:hypothetical protein